jgi:hypothetical protein
LEIVKGKEKRWEEENHNVGRSDIASERVNTVYHRYVVSHDMERRLSRWTRRLRVGKQHVTAVIYRAGPPRLLV